MKRTHFASSESRFTGLGNITIFGPICMRIYSSSGEKMDRMEQVYDWKKVTCKKCLQWKRRASR